MKVEVLFKSHRFEEFDTSSQTCGEPYKGRGTAVLMDWNLYLDDLEGQGIVLVQHWYDGRGSGGKASFEGVQVPVAARSIGCAMLLVAPEDLDDVVWLKKDGEKILWRDGDALINGERFFSMEQLCYSDAFNKSVNARAVVVFDYLSRAHPDWDEDEVAQSMGYTVSAIERIRDAEEASAESEVFGNEDRPDDGAGEEEGSEPDEDAWDDGGEAAGEGSPLAGMDFS